MGRSGLLSGCVACGVGVVGVLAVAVGSYPHASSDGGCWLLYGVACVFCAFCAFCAYLGLSIHFIQEVFCHAFFADGVVGRGRGLRGG